MRLNDSRHAEPPVHKQESTDESNEQMSGILWYGEDRGQSSKPTEAPRTPPPMAKTTLLKTMSTMNTMNEVERSCNSTGNDEKLEK